jgi:hypothetical protein
LDEISQTPTREVEAVLAAVDACPGGSLWILGDPRQSQPVGPGGMADQIEQLAASGCIPSARLTVNRRQIDPTDRQALDLLRRGEVTGSQQLRTEHGWEHEHASPGETRRAMAAAICADINTYGAEAVAALVVSHTDAEDLADRIRTRLADTGAITGPALIGPGWTTDRDYQAGDRVLLHARYGPSGSRLVNGATGTVIRVEGTGLAVRVDRSGEQALLPASFVQGTRKDGSPNLSHSWARTVDGAQGGTWETCHLLGSAALDAYRGYTGQSRSRQPTHTWNTKQLVLVDHGGVLADQRDAAEVVAQALARQPDPTLAARSDPWTVDRQLRDQIAQHERVLAGRPADPDRALDPAITQLRTAEAWSANMDAVATYTASQLEAHGALAGFSRRGRQERCDLQEKLTIDRQRTQEAWDRRDEIAARVADLQREEEAVQRFENVEGWRRDDIRGLHQQLDDHWARVVAASVRADAPLAFGIDKLRHARATTAARVSQLDDSIPPDRAEEWHEARAQLPTIVRARHEAEAALAGTQASLDEASRRRWGRHDHDAINATQHQVGVAIQDLERAGVTERNLREQLARISSYQQERQQAIKDSAPKRKELETTLAQLDGALDHTRSQRVHTLSSAPTPDLVERLGEPPASAAGRAVWCHHALPIEAALDRNDGVSPRKAWSPQTDRARQEIAVADGLLEAKSGRLDPTEWAELARQAATIREQAVRNLRVRKTIEQKMAPTHQPDYHLGIDHSVGPLGTEIGP